MPEQELRIGLREPERRMSQRIKDYAATTERAMSVRTVDIASHREHGLEYMDEIRNVDDPTRITNWKVPINEVSGYMMRPIPRAGVREFRAEQFDNLLGMLAVVKKDGIDYQGGIITGICPVLSDETELMVMHASIELDYRGKRKHGSDWVKSIETVGSTGTICLPINVKTEIVHTNQGLKNIVGSKQQSGMAIIDSNKFLTDEEDQEAREWNKERERENRVTEDNESRERERNMKKRKVGRV